MLSTYYYGLPLKGREFYLAKISNGVTLEDLWPAISCSMILKNGLSCNGQTRLRNSHIYTREKRKAHLLIMIDYDD